MSAPWGWIWRNPFIQYAKKHSKGLPIAIGISGRYVPYEGIIG